MFSPAQVRFELKGSCVLRECHVKKKVVRHVMTSGNQRGDLLSSCDLGTRAHVETEHEKRRIQILYSVTDGSSEMGCISQENRGEHSQREFPPALQIYHETALSFHALLVRVDLQGTPRYLLVGKERSKSYSFRGPMRTALLRMDWGVGQLGPDSMW